MRKPDFFIVGAPKCGTTAMQNYLSQHPDIFMPEIKEIHHFGSDLRNLKRMESCADYLSLFEGATTEKRVGETSVWHLYSKVAAEEIKEFNPQAQAIIMLRNPVDKIYSNHSHALSHGIEPEPDLERALAEELERKQATVRRGPLYKELLGYTEQVERYVDVFGWKDLHIIIYDDFKNDTAGTYRKTLEFLGVDSDFTPEIAPVNSNKGARNHRLQRILGRPPGALRAVGGLLPQSARRGLVMKLRGMNMRYEQREPMDPDLRQRLQAEFAPEVERLSELLGRDLTHWSRDQV